jgi:hypothetical protein
MSCVRIRIRDVGKGNLSKQRYPYVTITGLGEKCDKCWGGMSLELCYYNLLFHKSFRAKIHISGIHLRDDGDLIDMCWQSSWPTSGPAR